MAGEGIGKEDDASSILLIFIPPASKNSWGGGGLCLCVDVCDEKDPIQEVGK